MENHLKERKPSPFIRQWWTKELSILKKTQNRLNGKSYKFRHVWDHPAYAEHKAAAKQFKDIMEETRSQDWVDWLESVTQQDLYIANQYITNEPSDYSSTRVPSLKTVTNDLPSVANDNESKTAALADSFFLPPPAFSRVPQVAAYPPPLKGICRFSQAGICQVICSLSPYKAPGPDKIPNIILIKYCEALIDHLFFIFKAVFEFDTYHPRWLKSVTLVLRKIGKTSYDVAKSYHP